MRKSRNLSYQPRNKQEAQRFRRAARAIGCTTGELVRRCLQHSLPELERTPHLREIISGGAAVLATDSEGRLFGVKNNGKPRPLHLAAALRFAARHVLPNDEHGYNADRLAWLLERAAAGLWTERVLS